MTQRLEQDAIIASLIEALREHGSWCGETHIQKAAFFLSQLAGQSIGFDFILYKHGPFSFELRDELTAMRANSILKLEATFPYGSRYQVTEIGSLIKGMCESALRKRSRAIDFVACKLAKHGVASLERLSTALYMTVNYGAKNRVERIRLAKPHIPPDLATAAVAEVDQILSEWSASVKSKNRHS